MTGLCCLRVLSLIALVVSIAIVTVHAATDDAKLPATVSVKVDTKVVSKDDAAKTAHHKEGEAEKTQADMGMFARAFDRARQRLALDMDLGFVHAFVSSLAMIVVSELGDKTFFIAAIMAMRHSRATVFLGAVGALGLMTVLSALLGFATTVIPESVTHILASGLFLVFGIKMMHEGWRMGEDEGKEEYEEVQADLKKREAEVSTINSSPQQQTEQNSAATPTAGDMEAGVTRTAGRRWFHGFVSAIFLQAFVLTFLAEWGDRSQITTIVLAAREEVIGVIIGGTLGHCFCTGLAVLGGRLVAQKISIRTVTLIGGVVFIIFAFSSFIIN